jgi:hypothetical protein
MIEETVNNVDGFYRWVENDFIVYVNDFKERKEIVGIG